MLMLSCDLMLGMQYAHILVFPKGSEELYARNAVMVYPFIFL